MGPALNRSASVPPVSGYWKMNFSATCSTPLGSSCEGSFLARSAIDPVGYSVLASRSAMRPTPSLMSSSLTANDIRA